MPHGVFGEFMGTMVLILLGNGVVANVLLKKSKGEGAGWMVIATGWGLAVMAGVFTAIACGSEGHLNPAVTLAAAVTSGDFSKAAVVHPGTTRGSVYRSLPCLAALSASLARNTGDGFETRLLRHWSGDPEPTGEFDQRNHWHVRSGFGRGRDFLQSSGGFGTGGGAGPLAGGKSGLGYRTRFGWNHGLCHQSRTRSGAANRPCDFADPK